MVTTDTLKTFFGQRAIIDNQEYFQTRFGNNGIDYSYPPRIVDIHLGYKGRPCYLKCVWCFDRNGSKNPKKWTPELKSQFEKELIKTIEWEKNGYKIEKIHLAGGGEPSVYPDIASMVISYFGEADREAWIITNGVRIPEPLFSTLLEKGTGVQVSLPGTDRDSYQKYGGRDFYERVMGTVEDFANAREEIRSCFQINVTHVLMPDTLASLEDTVLRLDSMNVDEFRIRYDIFSDPNEEYNVRGMETVEGIIRRNPDLRMKLMLKSPDEETLPKTAKCYSSFVWPTWNPLYGVFPCAHITDEKNRIDSEIHNGIYSLIDIKAKPAETLHQECHGRCPSTIHWFNLYLNNLIIEE
ncbi:radical SAM protein [Candidatus Woesearchaeota archaeon]|nr:radical SAM protein [Candidatus Woesearchaeota archaeon]